MCVQETGRVKNYLGKCSLKVTRPDGECSEILLSNPDSLMTFSFHYVIDIVRRKLLVITLGLKGLTPLFLNQVNSFYHVGENQDISLEFFFLHFL